jgi:signal transduction histidine kinase/CheY-like chemotaxis protein
MSADHRKSIASPGFSDKRGRTLATPQPPDGSLLELSRQLAATQATLHELIDRNADGMLVLGLDGRIRTANLAAERFLARSRAELIGQPFGLPLVPGERTEIDLVAAAAPGRRPSVMVADMSCVNFIWNHERALLVCLHDISRHKRAEEELRFLVDASRDLAGSLDQSTVVACVIRLAASHLCDWCILDLVAAIGPPLRAAAANPCDPNLARQLSEYDLSPLDATCTDAIAQTLESGRACADPAVYGLAPTGRRPALVAQMQAAAYACLPLFKEGRPLAVLTLVWQEAGRLPEPADLSLAETFVRRATDALANAGLYLASREEIRRKAEFLAMLGHELRNPLAAVRAAAALLPGGTGPATVIERQTAHMSRLIDDLLEVSRLTCGRIQLQVQPTDLRQVIQSAVHTCKTILDERRHHLTIDLPDQPLPIDGDPDRLQQVVANLVHNAAKYTDPNGRIRVQAVDVDPWIVIQVRDNGPGLDPQLIPQLFEMFVSGSQDLDRSRGGLGIGLSLVRGLVEMHGGEVVASSDGPGQGSLFEVRLPRRRAPLPERSSDTISESAFSRRILLVEDNDDSREMLGELLRAWGHEVELASDGLTGLVKATTGWPEIALVDIGLPGCTGYELAEQVRAHETRLTYRQAPLCLIAMTGYGLAEDRQKALAAGFDRHLVKPVDPMELGRLLQSPPSRILE